VNRLVLFFRRALNLSTERGGQQDSLNYDFSNHWLDPVAGRLFDETGQPSLDLDLGEFLMYSDFDFLSHQLQTNGSGAIPVNGGTS
jgi:hypothetical protein